MEKRKKISSKNQKADDKAEFSGAQKIAEKSQVNSAKKISVETNSAKIINVKTASKKYLALLLLIFLIAIAISASSFILSFRISAFDISIYAQNFTERLSKPEADKYLSYTGTILDYLLHSEKGQQLSIEGMSSREISHMSEVRDLVQAILSIGIAFFILAILLLFVIFLLDRKGFARSLSSSLMLSGSIIILVFILGMLASLDFSSAFTLFHLASFRTDTWLLPPDSLLITMFPQDFFFSMASRIFILSLVFGILLIFASKLVLIIAERQKTQHRPAQSKSETHK